MLAFPVEAVPDGAILAPHHLYIGALLVILGALRAWDDHPKREPIVAMSGAIAACFAFLTVWPLYHWAGAAITVIATGLLVAAPLIAPFWREYRWRSSRALVLLGGLVMLDDIVSHAFGVWTPLDGWIWRALLYPVIA